MTDMKQTVKRTDKTGLCKICGVVIPKPKRGPGGKTCSNACKQKLYRAKPVTPQPVVSKTRNTPVEQPYTASSIAILSDSECMSNPAFDWELAQQLAEDFRRPPEWIRRGLAACRDAGVELQYFIDRYLHRKSIPMDIIVDKSFRDLNAHSKD